MKKKNSKPQQRNNAYERRRLWRLLRCSATAIFNPTLARPAQFFCQHLQFITFFGALLLVTGCAQLAVEKNEKISFSNLPATGSWLPTQRELLVCKTKHAARQTADFGLFHPLCSPLKTVSPKDYQVTRLELMQLQEGPMWLIHATKQGQIVFVPVPWHDWI